MGDPAARLLAVREFLMGGALNSGVRQGKPDAGRDLGLSKCNPNDPVWVVVRSQNCVVDWGIPDYPDNIEPDSTENGVLNASFVLGLYGSVANPGAGYLRRRYVRTGLAGSCEAVQIAAGQVGLILATVVYVAALGYDPELGVQIAAVPPRQRATLLVFDRCPIETEWTRSVSFAGDNTSGNRSYQPEVAADDSTVLLCPPRFARYVSVYYPQLDSDVLTVQQETLLLEVSSGITLYRARRQYVAVAIPPWCYLALHTQSGAAGTTALVTWSVRPQNVYYPDLTILT